MKTKRKTKGTKSVALPHTNRLTGKTARSLGPVSDLERHLPSDWWSTLFNSLYLKTDGDVVENQANTSAEVDLLITATGIEPTDAILDVVFILSSMDLVSKMDIFCLKPGIKSARYPV